jgi:hypothetical protein
LLARSHDAASPRRDPEIVQVLEIHEITLSCLAYCSFFSKCNSC